MTDTFIIDNPIALSAQNYNDFAALHQAQSAQTIKPTDIYNFVKTHERDAFARITRDPHPDGRPRALGERHDLIANAYTQTLLWSANKDDPSDPTKMAVLYMDILPKIGADGETEYVQFPRRWLIGSNAQGVYPYQMSCCTGLSAVAVFKQNGQLSIALLENARFMKQEYQDVFKLNGDSLVEVDVTGDQLRHVYMHMRDMQHSCHNHAAINKGKAHSNLKYLLG